MSMSDLISRQDALDVLRNLAFDHMFQCGEYYGEDERQLTIINARKAIDVIEAMPSAEPERKWFPVTDALPEEEKNVLVTVHFDGFKNAYTNIPPSDYVDIASQYEGYWSSPSDEYKVAESRHHVIAWMPLPEPWRGER